MSLLRSHKQSLAWLLAMLLFGSAGGKVLLRLSLVRSGCVPATHTCCCGHTGSACCCDGHAGAARQLASLSACVGANKLASLWLTPPALLPQTAGEMTRLRVIAADSAARNTEPSSVFPPPSTPPPQAA